MKLRRTIVAVAAGAAALAITPAGRAQPRVDWSTIDNGGGALVGGIFAVTGTIGQPDARNTVSGGVFTISGGFWAPFEIFCPADFNRDGSVDFFDYLDFVQAFDSEDPTADFNGDNTVDFFDYLDFVAAFDTEC
jgi:hypothetical protein